MTNEDGKFPKVIAANSNSLIAMLLSWLVPGAGQLYLGMMGRAIVFFALVGVPYAVGMVISSGVAIELGRFHAFHSTQPILAAFAVIPECLALGATLIAGAFVGGAPIQNPWDPGMPWLFQFGPVLTGMAGVISAIGIADAHHQARVADHVREPEKDGILAAGLTWLVPGLGHWYLGRKGKGVLLFCTMAVLFSIGLVMGGFACVYRRDFYFYWSGQILLGGFTALTGALTGDPVVTEFLPRADLGFLITTSAGLLNVLLIINAYSTAEQDAGREPTPDQLAKRRREVAEGTT